MHTSTPAMSSLRLVVVGLIFAAILSGCGGSATVSTVSSNLPTLTCGQSATLTAATTGTGAANALVIYSADGPVTLANPPQATAVPDAAGTGGVATSTATGQIVTEQKTATLFAEVKNSGQTKAQTTVLVNPCPGTSGYATGTGWTDGKPGAPATGDPLVTVTPNIVKGNAMSYTIDIAAPASGDNTIRSIEITSSVAIAAPTSSPSASTTSSLPVSQASATGWFFSYSPCAAVPLTITLPAGLNSGGTITFKVRTCNSDGNTNINVAGPQ